MSLFAEERARLNRTLDMIEDARQLVGREVPWWAREWAEKQGLAVVETAFAPPGRLYITGALPVDNGTTADGVIRGR